MNLFQTREGSSGIVIACMLCLTKHIRTHINSKMNHNTWQMMNFTSRSKFINKWWSCLIPGRNGTTPLPDRCRCIWKMALELERSPWDSYVTGSSWNRRVVERGKGRPSFEVVHVHLCLCVWDAGWRKQTEREVCVCMCVHVCVWVPVCVCVWDGDRGSRRHSLRHKRSQMWGEKVHIQLFPGRGMRVLRQLALEDAGGAAAERAG